MGRTEGAVLLVAQDFLQLVVGTLVACGMGVRELASPLLPVYVAAALVVDEGVGSAAGVVRVEVVASQPREPGGRGATAVGSGARQPPLAT